MKEEKQSAERQANHKSFDYLLVRFARLSVAIKELITISQTEFSWIVPGLKRAGEMLGQLQQHVNEPERMSSQPDCLILKMAIQESYTALSEATVHIQFFDIMQQQLEHLTEAFIDQMVELQGLVACTIQPSEVLCLHGLPDLLRIHTVQLTSVEEYYFAELGVCKKQVRAAMDRIRWVMSQVEPKTKDDLLRDSCSMQLFTAQPYQLILEQLTHFQLPSRSRGAGHAFRRIIATMQTLLTEVGTEYKELNLPEDSAAKLALLKRVRSRYTMQREWDMHDRVLGNQTDSEAHSAARPEFSDHDIELF